MNEPSLMAAGVFAVVRNPSFQAATEALAPFIVDRAAALALLVVGGRRKGGRWAGIVDCRLPSPPEWRGTTWDDESSFHFNWTAISKATWPTLLGALIQRKNGRSGRGVAFEAYLGRPGAAELVSLDGYEDYLLRDAPFDWKEVEDEEGGPHDLAITNIPGGRAGRERFWRAVERHERAPKALRLHFHPEQDPDYDSKVDEDVPAGSPISAQVKKEWAAWREHRQTCNARFLGEWLEVSPDQAGPLLQAIATRRLLGQADLLYPTIENATPKNVASPVTFESRGGGRIQYRGEMELPHDLSPRERRRIALMFAMLLGKWEFRFTMVVHTPDPHGNPKNKHLHVIFYDRPCEFVKEYGKWDFEIQARSTNPKNAGRPSYPYRQEKVKAVSQSRGRSGFVESGKAFFKYLRAEFAKIVNTVLEQCDVTVRLNPNTYEKMGIDVTPMSHWGKGNSALEKAGVPTRKIVLEAIKRWDDLEELTRAEFDVIKAENRTAHKEIVEWLAKEGQGRSKDVRETIQAAADRRRLLADEYAAVEFERDMFRLRFQRLQSRANVILRAREWATEKDLVDASERIEAAKEHILKVEDTVEPFQARFFQISDEQYARRREIRSADEVITLCRGGPMAPTGVDLDAPSKDLVVSEDAPWPRAPAQATPVAEEPIALPSPPPAPIAVASKVLPPPPRPSSARSAPTPLPLGQDAAAGPVGAPAGPAAPAQTTRSPPLPLPQPMPAAPASAAMERARAAEADRLAAEDRKSRAELAAAIEWAKEQPVFVDRIGEGYFCSAFQNDNPPGIAALLKRPELKAIANDALKAIYDLQVELTEALNRSPRIVFERPGKVAKESVPAGLQNALAVRATLPKWVGIAALRAYNLDQAATTSLVAEIEQKHIRARLADGGQPLVDTSGLSAEGRTFLSDPENRLVIGAALKPLIERQSSMIKGICDLISKDERTVGSDGKLNVDLLPKDLKAAASAWASEAEVVSARQRWVTGHEKIVAKLRAQEENRAERLQAEAEKAAQVQSTQEEERRRAEAEAKKTEEEAKPSAAAESDRLAAAKMRAHDDQTLAAGEAAGRAFTSGHQPDVGQTADTAAGVISRASSAQGQGEQPRSPAPGTTQWGTKFDRIIEDSDTDSSGITPIEIDIVRASLAGQDQALFASRDEYGICLCSRDDRVADILAKAEFSLLIALHGLAKERGGERPLFGHRIIIPSNPGVPGIGRGFQR